MPLDETSLGYPLPHEDNVASKYVARIREAIVDIDYDIDALNKTQIKLKDEVSRHFREQFLGIWSSPYAANN
jgi:hypothetical protein